MPSCKAAGIANIDKNMDNTCTLLCSLIDLHAQLQKKLASQLDADTLTRISEEFPD